MVELNDTEAHSVHLRVTSNSLSPSHTPKSQKLEKEVGLCESPVASCHRLSVPAGNFGVSKSKSKSEKKDSTHERTAPPTRVEKLFGEKCHSSNPRSEITVLFTFAIFAIYFVQGSMEIASLSARLYLMEQHQSPADISILVGMLTWPWIPKFLYGFISDSIPICGYHRKPYLIFSGSLGCGCLLLASMGVHLHALKGLFILLWFSIAIADVVADAIVVEKSEGKSQEIATNLQCFAWGARALGGIISSFGGGAIIDLIGPQQMFAALSLFPGFILFAGLTLKEVRSEEVAPGLSSLCSTICNTLKLLWQTLTQKSVLRPTLFVFFMSSTPTSSQAVEYFFVHELHFDATFLGLIGGVSSIGFLIALFAYQRWLKNVSTRKLFFWSTIAAFLVGSTQLLLVTRYNLTLGIPDHFFAISDTFILRFTGVFQFMTVLVLCARICPAGIEGTLFACLMGLLNAAASVGDFFAAVLTTAFDVTCTQVKNDVDLDPVTHCNFSSLWIIVSIAQATTLLPLFFLWLVPAGHEDANAAPAAENPVEPSEPVSRTPQSKSHTRSVSQSVIVDLLEVPNQGSIDLVSVPDGGQVDQ